MIPRPKAVRMADRIVKLTTAIVALLFSATAVLAQDRLTKEDLVTLAVTLGVYDNRCERLAPRLLADLQRMVRLLDKDEVMAGVIDQQEKVDEAGEAKWCGAYRPVVEKYKDGLLGGESDRRRYRHAPDHYGRKRRDGWSPFDFASPVRASALGSAGMARIITMASSAWRHVPVLRKTALSVVRAVSYPIPSAAADDLRVSPAMMRRTRRDSAGVKPNLSLSNAI
jgi:hypothetical protein